jgi:hypothetical protein
MVRLELGLPVELVELGTLLDTSLSRAQYLSLLERGIATADQFDVAKCVILTEAVGITRARILELQELVRIRRKQQDDLSAPLLSDPTE